MVKKSWEIIITHERKELEEAGYVMMRACPLDSTKHGRHAHSEFSALENMRLTAAQMGADAVLLLHNEEPRLYPSGTCWYAEGIPYYKE